MLDILSLGFESRLALEYEHLKRGSIYRASFLRVIHTEPLMSQSSGEFSSSGLFKKDIHLDVLFSSPTIYNAYSINMTELL